MKNICTMKNALNAYQKARRCKRYRPEVLEFEANREEYLGKAIRELESLTYTPGKYKVFKVWEPKERIIMALPFYDRVIQHMIVNYIEPIFEHQFIYHSYACRKGKGAHRASKQLTRWEKQIEIFLADVLKLQLNPKTTIVYAKNGVDFVGYRHWNSTKKIRKDAMRRLKRLMKNFKDGTITEEFFDKSFTSRIGSIKRADTYNLVQKITCEAKELKESHA